MFQANASREEVLSLSKHGEAVKEVEDFFRSRRWCFQQPTFALSRFKRYLAVAWVMDLVPDVPIFERDRLALGLFHSASRHYRPRLYAGIRSEGNGPYAAVRRVPYSHKKPMDKMLKQWREIAFDNFEILNGLRSHKIKKPEIATAAMEAARRGHLPWEIVAKLCNQYKDQVDLWNSWSVVSAFLNVIANDSPTKQMEWTVEFIKHLPLDKDYVSIPEI